MKFTRVVCSERRDVSTLAGQLGEHDRRRTSPKWDSGVAIHGINIGLNSDPFQPHRHLSP